MAKKHYKVLPQDVQVAKDNGIPTSTLYRRLSLGWDVERATTEKPKSIGQVKRASSGEVLPSGLGRVRSIRLTQELDDLVDQLIEDSGQPAIEFFRSILEPEIQKRIQKQKKVP